MASDLMSIIISSKTFFYMLRYLEVIIWSQNLFFLYCKFVHWFDSEMSTKKRNFFNQGSSNGRDEKFVDQWNRGETQVISVVEKKKQLT